MEAYVTTNSQNSKALAAQNRDANRDRMVETLKEFVVYLQHVKDGRTFQDNTLVPQVRDGRTFQDNTLVPHIRDRKQGSYPVN